VPTILELCRVESLTNIAGRSLAPLVGGARDRHRDHVISEYADNTEAMSEPHGGSWSDFRRDTDHFPTQSRSTGYPEEYLRQALPGYNLVSFEVAGGASMAFTVGRKDGGTKDAEFEAYVRLLRQQGVDLGRLPRAPEPRTGRRWLYVWDSREQAQAFAHELEKRTHDPSWVVFEVAAPSSEGPLGPIMVQVGRRASGLVFGLHPSSRAMILSAFPDAKGAAATISINFDTSQDLSNTHGSIEDLARRVVPTLTGLKAHELEKVGYALIEDDTNRTLVFVRPGDLIQA
jgi:hypothetical protein